MRTVNLIGFNAVNCEKGELPLISAKRASRLLQMNYSILKNAIESTPPIIQYQSKTQDKPGMRPNYGFVVAYIEEVANILNENRMKGKTLLNDEVKNRLLALNRKWPPAYETDWNLDTKKTKKVLRSVK